MPHHRDGFTPAFFLLFFAVCLFFTSSSDMDRVLNLWLSLPLFLMLVAGVTILIFVQYTVSYVVTRRWRRLASLWLAVPAGTLSISLLTHFGVTPEWLHLHFDRANYFAEAARLPGAGTGTAFHRWDWGGTGGAATVNEDYTLIYDESDEIALEPRLRSAAWHKRTGIDRSVVEPDVSVTRLEGHFFLVIESYD